MRAGFGRGNLQTAFNFGKNRFAGAELLTLRYAFHASPPRFASLFARVSLPFFAERAARQFGKSARCCPCFERVKRRAINQTMKRLKNAAQLHRGFIQRGTTHQKTKAFPRQIFRKLWFFSSGVTATLQQMMMQINFHRTRLGAGAAQRRGA